MLEQKYILVVGGIEQDLDDVQISSRLSFVRIPQWCLDAFDVDAFGQFDCGRLRNPEARGIVLSVASEDDGIRIDPSLKYLFSVYFSMWINSFPMGTTSLYLIATNRSGEWTLRHTARLPRLSPQPVDNPPDVESQLWNKIELHAEQISAARDNDRSPLALAINTSLSALAQENGLVRYPLLWIALESLFGPTSSGETTFRLTQNLALFLESEGSEQRELKRRAKRAYDVRSSIVHGVWLKDKQSREGTETVLFVEGLIKRSLLKILNDGNLVSVFTNDKQRNDFLDNLPFNQCF